MASMRRNQALTNTWCLTTIMLFTPLLPISLHLILTSYLVQHASAQSTRFKLRHAHGLVANSSQVVFSDYESTSTAQFTGDGSDGFEIPARSMTIARARSQADFFAARSLGRAQYDLSWEDTEVIGPDVSKRETLLMLANMTNNAYYIDRGRKGWYNLGPEWNTVRTPFPNLWRRLMAPQSYPFGWEPDADGFRGHIFTNEDNSTVILSVKGTSTSWIVGDGGPTVRKDKMNDNLLFSCCCARVGPTWSTVCGCYEGSYKCDQNCLEKSLADESLFYSVGIVSAFVAVNVNN